MNGQPPPNCPWCDSEADALTMMPSADPKGLHVVCTTCGASGPVRDTSALAMSAWGIRACDLKPKAVGDNGYAVAYCGDVILLTLDQAKEWLEADRNKIVDDRFFLKRDLLVRWGFKPRSKYSDPQMKL